MKYIKLISIISFLFLFGTTVVCAQQSPEELWKQAETY